MTIHVAGSIRHPDGFVVCRPMSDAAAGIQEPVAMFEVSGASTGRIGKDLEYEAKRSVQRHVMREKDRTAAVALPRSPGTFDSGAMLHVSEIGVEPPLLKICAETESGPASVEDDG